MVQRDAMLFRREDEESEVKGSKVKGKDMRGETSHFIFLQGVTTVEGKKQEVKMVSVVI